MTQLDREDTLCIINSLLQLGDGKTAGDIACNQLSDEDLVTTWRGVLDQSSEEQLASGIWRRKNALNESVVIAFHSTCRQRVLAALSWRNEGGKP